MMGCDIHFYREKLIGNTWVTADVDWVIDPDTYYDESGAVAQPLDWEATCLSRNYSVFGLLSQGVRVYYEYAWPERGLPEDTSPEVSAVSRSYGDDGHSHSWLAISELRHKMTELLLEPSTDAIQWQLQGLQQILLRFHGVDGDDHRMVFWFDN